MSESETKSYQVLARKYRPETFADLVGQDAMVRTLKNAFDANRIAQAFVMTGIRGTGKTTTARIIAKGINCIGPDGNSGPTIEPCGQCEHCQAIIEGRHVDVMEMDAASRTGVDDIREIIESVHYRAASARYKIYIIDEVHMLSNNAFNALLKTLEEPPAHVKFIFATTEIRKVPVTVLSRCQRFDLRRIEPEDMIALLSRIATAEEAEIAQDALAMITRAAEGSARDATSLLDQAISHGAGETTADQVRAMLGLADRGRILDLFHLIVSGDTGAALLEIGEQYADGADPMAVLRDLAEVTHWVSVVKITPDAAQDPTVSPDERARGLDFSQRLPMRVLSRMWQMLLKALEEVSNAPNSMMAAEMAIIRLTHVADLPTPDELVRKLSETPPPPSPPRGGDGSTLTANPSRTQNTRSGHADTAMSSATIEPNASAGQSNTNMLSSSPALAIDQGLALYPSFDHVIELIRSQRDVKLLVDAEAGIRLVSYQPGRIEFEPAPNAPNDLAQRLGARLQTWTGKRWAISIVKTGGHATIREAQEETERALIRETEKHPLVQAVISHFPKAKITKITTHQELAQQAQNDALPEVDEEWDPFEEN